MQQIREVLDEPLHQKGFVYDKATTSYTKAWEGLENVNYGYFFIIKILEHDISILITCFLLLLFGSPRSGKDCNHEA